METLTVWPPLAPTWKVRLWAALAVVSAPVPLPASRFLLLNWVVLAMRSMLSTAC